MFSSHYRFILCICVDHAISSLDPLGGEFGMAQSINPSQLIIFIG